MSHPTSMRPAGTIHKFKLLTFIDICSGAGGLASGLEQSGFEPTLLLDNLAVACESLRLNRPNWDVRQMDLLAFDPSEHEHTYDIDLLTAGLPRVKASATVNRNRGSDTELELLKVTVWSGPRQSRELTM